MTDEAADEEISSEDMALLKKMLKVLKAGGNPLKVKDLPPVQADARPPPPKVGRLHQTFCEGCVRESGFRRPMGDHSIQTYEHVPCFRHEVKQDE